MRHGCTVLFLVHTSLKRERQDARKSLERSLKLRPSVHAFRNLATFAPTADEAAELYQRRGWWETLLATRRDQARMTEKGISAVHVSEEEMAIVENLGKDLASDISRLAHAQRAVG